MPTTDLSAVHCLTTQPPILTRQQARALALTLADASHSEAWVALLMTPAETPVAWLLVYAGAACPAPLSLDLAPVVQAAAQSGTALLSVHLHRHPWQGTLGRGLTLWQRLADCCAAADVDLIDHIIADPDGVVFSRWGPWPAELA